jgi:hypothetical protein
VSSSGALQTIFDLMMKLPCCLNAKKTCPPSAPVAAYYATLKLECCTRPREVLPPPWQKKVHKITVHWLVEQLGGVHCEQPRPLCCTKLSGPTPRAARGWILGQGRLHWNAKSHPASRCSAPLVQEGWRRCASTSRQGCALMPAGRCRCPQVGRSLHDGFGKATRATAYAVGKGSASHALRRCPNHVAQATACHRDSSESKSYRTEDTHRASERATLLGPDARSAQKIMYVVLHACVPLLFSACEQIACRIRCGDYMTPG